MKDQKRYVFNGNVPTRRSIRAVTRLLISFRKRKDLWVGRMITDRPKCHEKA